MMFRTTLIIGAIFFLSTPLSAEELPDLVKALLTAAEESGDPAEVRAVADAVKKVFPDYAEAIEETSSAKIAVLTPPKEIEPVEEIKPVDGIWRLGKWEGKASAGAALASGNSDNLNVGIAIDAIRTHGIFTHNIAANFDIASSNPDPTNPASSRSLTQKRWFTAYQLDAAFSDRSYGFGRISYEEDEFSGFDYRLFGAAGLGHFLYQSEPFTWKVEGGPGYRLSPIDFSRETESEFALYGSTEIDWVIRPGVIFEQDLNYTWTSPTSTLTSTTSLSTVLTDSISTGISYYVRYETNPPAGNDNVDTLLRASVNYGF